MLLYCSRPLYFISYQKRLHGLPFLRRLDFVGQESGCKLGTDTKQNVHLYVYKILQGNTLNVPQNHSVQICIDELCMNYHVIYKMFFYRAAKLE